MNYYIELMYYYIFLSEFEILMIFSHIEVFQDINIVILKIQYRPALVVSIYYMRLNNSCC